MYNIAFTWSERHFIIWTVIYILATLTILASMLLVALLNLSIFQPLRDKLAARKQARKEIKVQKAEANKQARIEALQNELDQLKKDE